MELNSITIVGNAKKAAGLKKLDMAGFAPLRSGLGVPEGKYIFTSQAGEQVFAIKPVQSAAGKQYGLTLVAGTLKGIDANNKHVSEVFGLTASDKQMVVTADQWNAIEPNKSYEVTVSAKARIESIVAITAPVSAPADTLAVEADDDLS